MIDIPKWHHFMKPLLEVLKEYGEMPRQEAIDAVVEKVGLSEEQLSVSINDEQLINTYSFHRDTKYN